VLFAGKSTRQRGLEELLSFGRFNKSARFFIDYHSWRIKNYPVIKSLPVPPWLSYIQTCDFNLCITVFLTLSDKL
jgi:hypothetical protein